MENQREKIAKVLKETGKKMGETILTAVAVTVTAEVLKRVGEVFNEAAEKLRRGENTDSTNSSDER